MTNWENKSIKSETFTGPTSDWYAVAYKGCIELYQPNQNDDGIDVFHSYVSVDDSDPIASLAKAALMVACLEASPHYELGTDTGSFKQYSNTQEWKGTFTLCGDKVLYDYEGASEMDSADVISFVTGWVLKDKKN